MACASRLAWSTNPSVMEPGLSPTVFRTTSGGSLSSSVRVPYQLAVPEALVPRAFLQPDRPVTVMPDLSLLPLCACAARPAPAACGAWRRSKQGAVSPVSDVGRNAAAEKLKHGLPLVRGKVIRHKHAVDMVLVFPILLRIRNRHPQTLDTDTFAHPEHTMRVTPDASVKLHAVTQRHALRVVTGFPVMHPQPHRSKPTEVMGARPTRFQTQRRHPASSSSATIRGIR